MAYAQPCELLTIVLNSFLTIFSYFSGLQLTRCFLHDQATVGIRPAGREKANRRGTAAAVRIEVTAN
ncbi:MAG: hypothetical protein M5U25_01010 [Planctomycetota bacterium]|nr:hypothetical protein [Planctomycetota bacterium]